MTTQTYSTSDDVAARWRELSDEETDLANTLCADASRRARARWKTIDARIANGTLDADDVRMVIAAVVKRAMINSGAEGVTNVSDTAGSFSQSRTFSNPEGNIYFSKEDVAVLTPVLANRVRSLPITLP